MLKIAEMRNDVMGRFHNALYLGDIRERVKILEDAGQSLLPILRSVDLSSSSLDCQGVLLGGFLYRVVRHELPGCGRPPARHPQPGIFADLAWGCEARAQVSNDDPGQWAGALPMIIREGNGCRASQHPRCTCPLPDPSLYLPLQARWRWLMSQLPPTACKRMPTG